MKRGQSAQLHCSYKLEGAPLYSVKWYRGNLEFYRYSPLEHPPAKIFPYTGIKVDVSSISFNYFIILIHCVKFGFTNDLLLFLWYRILMEI